MEVKIYTKIVKKENDSLTNQLEIINEILGNEISTNNFATWNVKSSDFLLDKTRATSFIPVDIFDLLQIAQADCSFLHLQIRDQDLDTIDENNIRFSVQFGNEIFDCSQFTLVNLDNFVTEVSIIAVDIPLTKTGVLTIIAGEK
jgi:hypothetical protein